MDRNERWRRFVFVCLFVSILSRLNFKLSQPHLELSRPKRINWDYASGKHMETKVCWNYIWCSEILSSMNEMTPLTPGRTDSIAVNNLISIRCIVTKYSNPSQPWWSDVSITFWPLPFYSLFPDNSSSAASISRTPISFVSVSTPAGIHTPWCGQAVHAFSYPITIPWRPWLLLRLY